LFLFVQDIAHVEGGYPSTRESMSCPTSVGRFSGPSLAGFGCPPRPETFANAASRMLAEAKEIDPACSEVHLKLSRFHCIWDWNWQKVSDEVQHSHELAADGTAKLLTEAWDGFYQARLGDLDRGLRQLDLVRAALPLYPHVWYFLAEAFYLARDFTRSAAASTNALELHPNCWFIHAMAGRAIAMLGDYSEGLRHLRMAKLLCPQDAGLNAAIAYIHAAAGKRDRATKLLSRSTANPGGQNASSILVAMVHAALGDNHRALNEIEQACAAREWYVTGLKRECCLDPLRADPRFRSVLSQVGIGH
jgi:tetratricopeptide (TPR) repeat protein